jgi:hypothetical protein
MHNQHARACTQIDARETAGVGDQEQRLAGAVCDDDASTHLTRHGIV